MMIVDIHLKKMKILSSWEHHDMYNVVADNDVFGVNVGGEGPLRLVLVVENLREKRITILHV